MLKRIKSFSVEQDAINYYYKNWKGKTGIESFEIKESQVSDKVILLVVKKSKNSQENE